LVASTIPVLIRRATEASGFVHPDQFGGRDNPKEERYFYGLAKGSVYEVVSLLVMMGKQGCLSEEKY